MWGYWIHLVTHTCTHVIYGNDNKCNLYGSLLGSLYRISSWSANYNKNDPHEFPTFLGGAWHGYEATWSACALHVLDKFSFVPSPHHTHTRGRVCGHWWRFLVPQAQKSCDYLHRFVLGSHEYCIGSCDGVQDQENISMSPEPFPLQRVGSGNETKQNLD